MAVLAASFVMAERSVAIVNVNVNERRVSSSDSEGWGVLIVDE